MATPWYRYWAQAVTKEFHVEPDRGQDPPGAEHQHATDPPGGSRAAATAVEPAEDPVIELDREKPGSAPAEPRVQDQDRAVEDDAAPPDDAFHVEPHRPPVEPTFEQARIVSIANQKGGVGKTTTAVSLAAALADIGSRVLLIDLDPQGNASSGVGLRIQPGQATIYDVLVADAELVDAIEPTSVRNLFVVPASIDLAGAEIELVSAFSREQKLRRALDSVRGDFDVMLIDCPPSLGLLTVNGLSAADGVIVPIQCEYYALEGLGALQRNAELIKANLNPDLDVTGFVMTMLDGRTRLGQQVVDEVVAHFGDRVFATRIPRSVRLAEAPSYGQPITVFDPTSRGAQAYRDLAREVLERLHRDLTDHEVQP